MFSQERIAEFRATLEELEKATVQDDMSRKVKALGVLAREREEEFRLGKRSSSKPVDIIVNTSLAINWKWTTAKSRIDYFLTKFPEINSLQKLNEEISKFDDCRKFMQKYFNLNAKSERNPKYRLLKSLTKGFLDLSGEYSISLREEDEIKILKCWAEKFLSHRVIKNDPIGRLDGVGEGTIYNMLLLLGYDVVKPDRHFKRMLNEHFNLSYSPSTLEGLCKVLGCSQVYLDKVLYEYGRNKSVER